MKKLLLFLMMLMAVGLEAQTLIPNSDGSVTGVFQPFTTTTGQSTQIMYLSSYAPYAHAVSWWPNGPASGVTVTITASTDGTTYAAPSGCASSCVSTTQANTLTFYGTFSAIKVAMTGLTISLPPFTGIYNGRTAAASVSGGPFLAPDGVLCTAPGYGFLSDPGTGWYYNGAGDIRSCHAGTQALSINATRIVPVSNGSYALGGSGNAWSDTHSLHFMAYGSTSTTVATAGDIRLANNQSGIMARNAINNGNISLLTLNASDVMAICNASCQSLTIGNKLGSYNGTAVAGWGIPAIYASGRSITQNAAVASVTTYTPTADGSFEVWANVKVTTATTHTFTIECSYTDEDNVARTLTMPFVLVAGGAIVTSITNTNGAVPYMGIPIRIRAKASTAILVRTQAAGTYTTVTYNVEASIMQIS